MTTAQDIAAEVAGDVFARGPSPTLLCHTLAPRRAYFIVCYWFGRSRKICCTFIETITSSIS